MADLGYDELGHDSAMGNSCKSFSPTINDLIDEGVAIHYYYTFKLYSPTRASFMAGQCQWGAGFYDMSDDGDHCMPQYKILPAILKQVAHVFTDEANRIINIHEKSRPLYIYLAYQNVHLACGVGRANGPLQAPCETVDLYSTTESRVPWFGSLIMELATPLLPS